MMNLVEVKQIDFAYRNGQKALEQLSLTVRAGERVAIMGPNGAGKSTLLLMLNGLLRPDTGCVIIDGIRASAPNLAMIRRKVGMVFQDSDDQLFNTTVYREVAYGPVNLKMAAEEREAAIEWALGQVGLQGFSDRTPFQLSGGEKKRVALASVLSMRPQILVLDEPTNALDPKSSASLVELLNTLNRDLGLTLLFATHDVDIVPELADRVILMEKGQVCFDGTPSAAFAEKELLCRLDLRMPRVAQLMACLMEDGLLPQGELPLTVEEARQMLGGSLAVRRSRCGIEPA